jgi:hypothetical protein
VAKGQPIPPTSDGFHLLIGLTETGKDRMKFIQRLFISLLFIIALAGMAVSQNTGAKQDMKNAGSDTKDAAKDTGSATKKTTKKSAGAVKRTTKKTTNKAAQKTDQRGAKSRRQNRSSVKLSITPAQNKRLSLARESFLR